MSLQDTSDGSAYPALACSGLARAVANESVAGGSPPRQHSLDQADAVFTALTPLLSARSSGRVWTGDGYGKSRRLGRKAPDVPVAVYLFHRGWTRLLCFDLDAKTLGADAVVRDARWLRHIVETAGGVLVEDVNPGSGGRHLYVPLASPAGIEHIRALLEALQPFCRTLDPTPMLNPRTGCIVPPGSWTKEGHRRQLIGTVTDAADLLARRSARGLIARLRDQLNATTIPRQEPQYVVAATAATEGVGFDKRLHPDLCMHTPLPAHVTDFAADGKMPHGFWNKRPNSKSEACQAVLYACAARGWSLNDVIAQLERGDWPALAALYAKKKRTTASALAPQWDRAFHHASEIAVKFLSPAHKKKHTGGVIGEVVHRDWLAHARAWAYREYARTRHLHVVLAVLQGLAVNAAHTGTLINGVPVVETGRRSLAIAAGLIPDRTVSDVLFELRERPGSPILQKRPATGVLADQYALVTPATWEGDERRLITESDPIRRERARVEAVHPAWRIVGLHMRTVYELVVHGGLSTSADIFAAAQISASAGSETLASLAAFGLIIRTRGRCAPGERTLDEVAAAHGLDHVRADTIARHRRERIEWHDWLELRGHIYTHDDPAVADDVPAGVPTPPPGWQTDDSEALWAARIADGEPADQPSSPSTVESVIALLMDELGATVLSPDVYASGFR